LFSKLPFSRSGHVDVWIMILEMNWLLRVVRPGLLEPVYEANIGTS